MIVALWIIAVCEVIRALQNMMQLAMLRKETGVRDNAYEEFVKSLKQTDREFVRRMLEEFEQTERSEEIQGLEYAENILDSILREQEENEK